MGSELFEPKEAMFNERIETPITTFKHTIRFILNRLLWAPPNQLIQITRHTVHFLLREIVSLSAHVHTP